MEFRLKLDAKLTIEFQVEAGNIEGEVFEAGTEARGKRNIEEPGRTGEDPHAETT